MLHSCCTARCVPCLSKFAFCSARLFSVTGNVFVLNMLIRLNMSNYSFDDVRFLCIVPKSWWEGAGLAHWFRSSCHAILCPSWSSYLCTTRTSLRLDEATSIFYVLSSKISEKVNRRAVVAFSPGIRLRVVDGLRQQLNRNHSTDPPAKRLSANMRPFLVNRRSDTSYSISSDSMNILLTHNL